MFGRLSLAICLLSLFATTSIQAQEPQGDLKYSPAEQLVLASFQLNVERVRSLLKSGVAPDVQVRVSTFAIFPDTGFGDNLLEYPSISSRSLRSYSWTPLLPVAYSRTHPAKVMKNSKIKEFDAKVLQDRDRQRMAIASLLIKQCVQLDLDDSIGTTPLNVALRNGYIPLALLLIRSGADPNLKPRHALDSEEIATPVHYATRDAEVLKEILKHGASVTVKDHTGHTPLDWAVYDFNVDSVRILIAAGADVNAQDDNGATPLYWLKNSQRIEGVDESRKQIEHILLDAGAKKLKTDSKL